MQKVFLFLLFSSPYLLQCQNLIANGSFEELNTCTEYNATCAPEAWFRIPPTELNVMTKKNDQVFEGEYAEVVVIENKNHPFSYRVFLYTMLLAPLKAQKDYLLTFHINPFDHEDYALDIVFTEEELITGVVDPLDYRLTYTFTKAEETEKKKKQYWRKMQLTYTAKGGEQFLTFGNFSKNALQFDKKTKPNNLQGDLIYLIDKVELTPVESNLDSTQQHLIASNRRLIYDTNHRHTYKCGITLPPMPPKKSFLKEFDIPKKKFKKKEEPIEIPKIIEKKQLKTFEIPDIAFDFDKAQLKPTYFGEIDSLIHEISNLKPKEIQIIGHTDNIGSDEYNLDLSLRRAEAVKQYFENTSNWMIKVEGKGENEPKLDNSTAENRSQNRRVEIIVKF